MPLRHIAHELEETARQSESMADEIVEALDLLKRADSREAAERAMREIVVALQAQDRMAQRCRGLARALTRMSDSAACASGVTAGDIWDDVTPGELWPEAKTTGKPQPAEIELF